MKFHKNVARCSLASLLATMSLLPAQSSLSQTADTVMSGTVARVCKLNNTSSPTQQVYAININSANNGNHTATIAGSQTVSATAACNDGGLSLKVTAPTPACAQQGNGGSFTFAYTVSVKVGSTEIKAVQSPATAVSITTLPVASTAYVISIDPRKPANSGAPNGTCTASVTLALS